ncbi:MAG: hypothetical protein GF329_02110 [Candidatus Lokiarchaeota archaeon]|nr:hypothetical protein [Candidatus Lokiarchaeota archaeon]
MEKIKPKIDEIGQKIKNYYETKKRKDSTGGEPGYLIVTTNNLLFFKERFDYEREYKLKYNFNLNNLLDIRFGGKLKKYIIINGIKFYPKNIKGLMKDLREHTDIDQD